MLELGIAGGRAVPLQKRTIGNTNISDVFDGENHIWPTRDDVAYFYDFDSIQLRFVWTNQNGQDFDTGTNITNAPGITSEIVGWAYGESHGRTQPYLYWGGDNTASGAECVMLDIKAIQDFYNNGYIEATGHTIPEQLVVQLRGNWYHSRLDGIVSVECTAYKGGTIVKAYQLHGSDFLIDDQVYVFADKDGWIFEEGMPNRVWIGEAVEIEGVWHKINQVDDSVEGMPGLTAKRMFIIDGVQYMSSEGYVTLNNSTFKTWNKQINTSDDIYQQQLVRIYDSEGNESPIGVYTVLLNEDGSEYTKEFSSSFRYGYVAGNSEKRGQQFIKSRVNSRNNNPASEEFAVINYFDKTESGQVVALNPIS